jgi:hypothetical protein
MRRLTSILPHHACRQAGASYNPAARQKLQEHKSEQGQRAGQVVEMKLALLADRSQEDEGRE